MTNQNSANATFKNETTTRAERDMALTQNRLSDADLDGVCGGQSTGIAWTGTPIPRR